MELSRDTHVRDRVEFDTDEVQRLKLAKKKVQGQGKLVQIASTSQNTGLRVSQSVSNLDALNCIKIIAP